MTPLQTWSLDREIVLSHVIDAPRARVFAAWTDPAQLCRWFGPAGFRCTTHEADIREGGVWRFDMRTPDGTAFANRMVFLTVQPPELLVYDHDSDRDDDPDRFRVTVTFDAQGDGKTVITLRQIHPTAARRQLVIGFGAVEFGYQTLDKLARHVDEAGLA